MSEYAYCQHFKNTLHNNYRRIRQLIITHFNFFIIEFPSFQMYWSSLRVRFPTNPLNTADDLLDKITVSDDIDLWKCFFTALDRVNARSARRLFISDEDLQSLSLPIVNGEPSSTSRFLMVYNIFIKYKVLNLYNTLNTELQAGRVRLIGYSESFNLRQLSSVSRFERGSIVQFISVDEPVEGSINDLVIQLVRDYLERSPLVILEGQTRTEKRSNSCQRRDRNHRQSFHIRVIQ